MGIAVGDTLTVETPGGEPAQLRVAGTVYDPSLAPAPQQQTANGYLSTATLAALDEPDVFDQLKVQIADPGQTQPSLLLSTILVGEDVARGVARGHAGEHADGVQRGAVRRRVDHRCGGRR
jgi:putative ABC transport system permease protein